MKKEITKQTKQTNQKPEKKSSEKNAPVSKHPKYYEHAKVICSCGNTFEVGSTMPEIRVEICSACHPLYTGKNKFIDAAGRVDKFQERVRKAAAIKEAKAKKSKPKIEIKDKNKKAK